LIFEVTWVTGLQIKQMLQIIPFQIGINTCYIIKDKGAVLVDAGYCGCAKSFARLLELHEIKQDEIRLIIPTHGDFDHAGGAKELKELTGAKIVMHQKDNDNLEQGIFHWPTGVTPWGKISRGMMLPFVLKPKLPIYAMDLELLKESWVKVINMGAENICPGHGKPFPVEKITRYLI